MMRIYRKTISLLLVMCLGLSFICTLPVSATDTSTADIIRQSGKREIDLGYWSEAADSHGADHVQGVCVDDKGEYMYASFTNLIVKLEIATSEIVGTVGGLATGTLVDGAHLGDITYYNGKLYAPLEYKASERWYIAVFDCEKITRLDMHYTEPGVMQALYVPQVGDAFCEEFDAGEHENKPSSMGHRYGAGGIDGITVGKLPGGGLDTDGDGNADTKDDKTYLFTVLNMYQNEKRYDNENLILLAFDPDHITEQNALPFIEENVEKEYMEEETYLYSHKIFCYVGNQQYGAQQLEYDKDTGDFWMECYRANLTTEFPKASRFVIDGTKPLSLQEVEVGQSVTGDASGFVSQVNAHTRAAFYTDYEDGDKDGDFYEQEQGLHASLKCLCGNGKTMEDHETVCHGKTGYPTKICGRVSEYCTGLASLGDDLFYGVSNTTTVKDGVNYFGGFAHLLKFDRESGRMKPYGGYPYVYRNFETEFPQAEGFGGSKNAQQVEITSKSYADVSYAINNTPNVGDDLYVSAWIKLNNTDLTNDKVDFILWGDAKVQKTAENNTISDVEYIKDAYYTLTANATGLKKGEWVQVKASAKDWNGVVRGTVPAGYMNKTEAGKDWLPDVLSFVRMSIRLNGTSYAKETVSSVSYDIDEVRFYATTETESVTTETKRQILENSSMDTQAQINTWNSAAVLVTEDTPDGSNGYMRIGDGVTSAWPQISQKLELKPNRLYKLSLWARLEKAVDGNGKGGIRLLQWASGRVPDTNGYNTNYPGITKGNILTNKWQKFEFYYLQERKTFVQETISTTLRFFTVDGNTLSKSVFGVDDIQLYDLGPITNGDFAISSGEVYKNNGTYSYNILGWTPENATAVLDNGAMKVTASKDGGRVYQGINMANGGMYKLSFKAKTTGEEKPLAAVLDRYVPSSGGDKEAYNVPDYQYITGPNDVSTTYADGKWKVTNEWQTYECYISNTFPLMEGKTAANGIIPRAPFLYFMAGGNKAGTELYIDDVVLEQVSMAPTLNEVSVSGENKPGEKLTVNGSFSSPNGTDGGCVMVNAVLKNGETYASLGTLYAGDSFTVPEEAVGKELMFAVTPIDSEGIIGETVYIAPDEAADAWGKLYYDSESKTARLYCSETTDAEIIFASYKDGELIDVEIVPVSAVANTKTTADGSALITTNADTIKIMAWNSANDAVPICENLEIE